MVNYPDVIYVNEIWSSALHLRKNIVNAILLITGHPDYTFDDMVKIALNPHTSMTVKGDTLEYFIYGLGYMLKGKLPAQVIDDLIYGEIDIEEARKMCSEYLDSFETDEEDLEESTRMGLKEAKQILKANGCRLLKESEGYTFRITGGKVTELLTGGKYQKTLKYDEKDAAEVLGGDTLDREFTDVNELVKAVVDDLTCLDDKGDVENVSAGVLHHLDNDSAATLDIHVSFKAVLGYRSKYKNKISRNADLIITGNTGAGSMDSDELATVLKAQLNTRNGEIKDLRRSEEYRNI